MSDVWIWRVGWVMVVVGGCSQDSKVARPIADAGVIVATWKSGFLSTDEVSREVKRLSPGLRDQFETPSGHQEFARAVVAKRLLLDEANRRGFTQRDDVRKQVEELETRLAVQALLNAEKSSLETPSEGELKQYFETNRPQFATPLAVRARRFLFSGDPRDPRLRLRAEGLRKQVLAPPMDFKAAAKLSDGPEKVADGDIGWVTRNEVSGAQSVLSLSKPGQVSAVTEVDGGLAFFTFIERREAHLPEFEEVRALVEARLAPTQEKRAYDALIARLMREADVQFMSVK
jgi:parvulin-like peptidyl-prolyl isomerase